MYRCTSVADLRRPFVGPSAKRKKAVVVFASSILPYLPTTLDQPFACCGAEGSERIGDCKRKRNDVDLEETGCKTTQEKVEGRATLYIPTL